MSNETTEVLREVWTSPADPDAEAARAALVDCGPGQTCRNMRHVTFDGMAEPGSDPSQAWRERLRREGKLGGSSLADLIRDHGGDAPAAG